MIKHETSVLFLADEEFDELCFDFGLELDEVVTEPVSNPFLLSYTNLIYTFHTEFSSHITSQFCLFVLLLFIFM